MSIRQISFSSTSTIVSRQKIWLSALALLLLSVAFSATEARAAGDSASATARYQADRAHCNSGQSNQDRATCLKEAGAALEESRRGHLHDDKAVDKSNAYLRCDALPAGDRDACQRRINGEGTTSGSVLDGGLSRELVVPDTK
jgi:hypothetical protein